MDLLLEYGVSTNKEVLSVGMICLHEMFARGWNTPGPANTVVLAVVIVHRRSHVFLLRHLGW